MAHSSNTGSAMESDQTLDDAVKANFVPQREYFLHGTILDSSLEPVMQRLEGLCDNPGEKTETFIDHEMCFNFERNEKLSEKPIRLRVRRSLKYKDQPYMLRYLGVTEPGNYRQPTFVRASIDVATSRNVVEFLTELGYRKEYEYVAKGYMFKKGRLKCTISKICRTKEINGKLVVLSPVTGSHLIEMSVMEHQSVVNSKIGHFMRTFAESLKPLVNMDKTDQFRLYWSH